MSYIIGPSWRAGMQSVSAAIDKTFGEPLLLIASYIPGPNFPPDRDRSVEQVHLKGEFLYRAKLALDNGGRPGQHGSGGLVELQEPIATFSHAALPWLPQRGDRIRREVDGTEWEITKVSSDGVSRVTCQLVQMGVSSP